MTDHGSNGLEASFPSPTSRRRLGVTSVDKLVTGAENPPAWPQSDVESLKCSFDYVHWLFLESNGR